MNSNVYLQKLAKGMLPLMLTTFLSRSVLTQDRAPAHKSNLITLGVMEIYVDLMSIKP